MKENSVFSLLVHVKKTCDKFETEIYDVDLKGLNDKVPLADSAISLEKVLDMVFSTHQKAAINTASSAQKSDLPAPSQEPLEVCKPMRKLGLPQVCGSCC